MQRPRVIIVDDDTDTVEIFTEYLDIKGIDVVATGTDGNQAFQLFKKHKPDVILLDIMMDGIDGFYALENIREFEPTAKVIVITADITQETKERLERDKPDVVVYKPYDIEKLVDIIYSVKDGQVVVLE